MVNPTACHDSAPNRLIEEVGRHPFSGVLGPSGCRSVGSPFTGAGFTTAEAMASAFPSRGMSDPAACLAVRDLGDIQFGCLGPGGKIRGSVAVPAHDQPATIATEGPYPQRRLLRGPATPRTGLGRGKPAVAYHQVAPEPRRLVSKLTSELGPGGIGDGSSEALVADQVGNR